MEGLPTANLEKLAALEARVGKGAALLHWEMPWKRDGQYFPFDAAGAQRARDHGSIPFVSFGAWELWQGADQADFQLADTITGAHDAYLRQFARDVRAWGHPLFLRLGWEMNIAGQFPWQEGDNGNRPGEFVLFWRHVVDIFRAEGATNATWVWAPNVIFAGDYGSYYPGDDYVDWVGLDGYNWGEDRPWSDWQGFPQVFDYSYRQLQALAPAKPIVLAEWACSENGGDKAAWVRDALGTQLPGNYPGVRAVVWFNTNAGDATLSWPIDSSPAAAAAFAAALASPYYAANQFAALGDAPIPAPQR